jgi:hypothetical protein
MPVGGVEGSMAGIAKMKLPGGEQVDGIPVGIKRSIEVWSEFELDDGTKLKAKITLISAIRAIKNYDPQGIPWYQLQLVPVISPMDVPDELKAKKEK